MKELIEAALKAVNGVEVVNVAGVPHPLIALPEGHKIASLEQFAEAPERVTGETTLFRVADFTGYVNDFKAEGARVFINPELKFDKGGKLATAVLDFPKPGMPAWSVHKANLVVQPSLEYELLIALDGQLMDQGEFAKKLRNIARFCTSLESADLLEIAQTLTLTSKGEFSSVEDNFSGSVRMGFDVQVSAKAGNSGTQTRNLEVPTAISFRLPLLLGGQPVDVVADFLYRTPASAGGKVQMGISLPDRKFIEREVLEETANQLAESVGLPVAIGYSGVPQAPASTSEEVNGQG